MNIVSSSVYFWKTKVGDRTKPSHLIPEDAQLKKFRIFHNRELYKWLVNGEIDCSTLWSMVKLIDVLQHIVRSHLNQSWSMVKLIAAHCKKSSKLKMPNILLGVVLMILLCKGT
ncbi:hypothetical protein JTB14_036622 [Gonioctena quinquepunctata]|nr:hypothetical protein JTB14_036622 [Gonioctena quinquepunctata]